MNLFLFYHSKFCLNRIVIICSVEIVEKFFNLSEVKIKK